MAKEQHGQEVSSSSMDLFLTSDERFQVWEVKAAERPHLLLLAACDVDENDNDNDAEKEPKDDGDDTTTASCCCSSTRTTQLSPISDGCDIPGWRRARIGFLDESYDNDDFLYGALCTGQGCTLMRRETQLPVGLSTRRTSRSDWKALQAKLLHVPTQDEGTTPGATMLNMIPRISYKDPKNSVLHAWFERESVPVLLEGCMSDWPAMQTCRWDALVNHEKFGGIEFKWRFSDTHGETLSLKTYDKYCKSLEGLTDDSPLAIYDSQFHTDERQCLLHDYQVPSCFDTDLFALLDMKDNDEHDVDDDENDHTISSDQEEDDDDEAAVAAAAAAAVERPPYRWILMGPERSGTGLHVDPVGTHAWVSLVQGCKRWVLFPPDTCRQTIGMLEEHQIPSVLWFRDYYENVCLPTGPAFVPGAVHVVQRPGETVYVPSGWPHLVLNLEASVAITENYATEYPSMDRLWRAVVEAEPALSARFREALERHRPDLAAQIGRHDANDAVAVVGGGKNMSYVSNTKQTTSHGVLKTCGEQEGTASQRDKDLSHGCRIVN